jgi:hypothetical protein
VELVFKAQSCAPGASGACAFKVPASLGCNGCPTWVNDLTELAPVYQQFNDMGCFGCFFGGPPGENRCHATGCTTLDIPMCRAAASGGGTCVNQPRDRTCGPGVMTGAPCGQGDDYCTSGGRAVCACLQNERRWSCF